MTPDSSANTLQARVAHAAETALARNGSVGPLELFQSMGFLQPVHVEGWRKGIEHYRVLEKWIQVGPEKLERTLRYFHEWANQRGLRTLEAAYTRRGPAGTEELRVTVNADPEREKFFRTHYVPGDLPEKKTTRLAAKLKRAPELVVFEKVSEEGNCAECGVELSRGDYLLMEKGQPLCLACGDLGHLLFLPAGNTALTRRARKYSTLSAVVVRFNRPRKRYERQGLLVSEAALARAEEECAADAPERAATRAKALIARQAEDRGFIKELTEAIAQRYPGCPVAEARQIAEHTGLRSSGRVGRSAAGRQLEPTALDLAVIAHIRHAHTKYDELLMCGADRSEARAQVRAQIEQVLTRWQGGPASAC